MSTVSVVIPAYNASAFIKASVGSALAQSLPPAEIFVVNDASTDDTVKKLDPFRRQIKVYSMKKNSGPGACRNKGASMVTGDYLAFLDADDIWEGNHLKNLAGLLDKYNDAGVAFCKTRTIGAEDKLWPQVNIPYDEPVDLFMGMMRKTHVIPSVAVVRRSLFEKVGGFKEIEEFYKGRRIQAEDYDFFLRAGRISKFICSSRPTTLYRRHEAQSSIHVAPQIVMSIKYRIRLINEMREEGGQEAVVNKAIEETLKRWREYLTSVCIMGNKEAIDYVMKYGLAEDLLKKCTAKFKPILMVPGSVLNVWRRIPETIRKVLDI